MPRARGLSSASAANRRKQGQPSRRRGGVDLPNLPQFVGPPSGTFDPGLEAQVRASERGLYDLLDKTRREGRRDSVDTRQARRLLERKERWGMADIGRQRGYALEDADIDRGQLRTSFERDLQDLAIARQQGEEDYNRRLTEIQHSYATRAAVQLEGSVAQGTFNQGTQAASAAVRSANQGYDRGIVDEAHGRFAAANALAEARAREDYANRYGLIDEGLGRDLSTLGIEGHRLRREGRAQRGQLRRDIKRATFDRHDLLSKAKREQGIFVSDVAQQAFYQAHQLNPNILFPVPAAAGGPGAPPPPGGRPRRPRAVVGVGAPAPRRPNTGGLTAPRPRRRRY